MEQLRPGEGPRYLTRLDEEDQQRLLELLPAENATQILKEIPASQAAQLLTPLTPQRAAALFELFPSNEQADLVAELGGTSAAVLRDLGISEYDLVEPCTTASPVARRQLATELGGGQRD